MSWEPKFQLVSVKPFITNLKAIFERDAEAAIAYFAQPETLRKFQAINTARQLAEQWPVLNLLPYGGDPKWSEDGARIGESQRVLVEVETASRVPNTLAEHLVTYVIAARSILYEMSVEDLTELVVEIPKEKRTKPVWDVSTERYGERLYEAENKFTMVGSVVLTINFNQGRNNA